jgi:hypothetical protein
MNQRPLAPNRLARGKAAHPHREMQAMQGNDAAHQIPQRPDPGRPFQIGERRKQNGNLARGRRHGLLRADPSSQTPIEWT